jgi:hypothetical protein
MGYWSETKGHGSDSEKIYHQLQEEIISIRGHARYLVDKMEKSAQSFSRVHTDLAMIYSGLLFSNN